MVQKNANSASFILNKMLKYTKHACESKMRNYVRNKNLLTKNEYLITLLNIQFFEQALKYYK